MWQIVVLILNAPEFNRKYICRLQSLLSRSVATLYLHWLD